MPCRSVTRTLNNKPAWSGARPMLTYSCVDGGNIGRIVYPAGLVSCAVTTNVRPINILSAPAYRGTLTNITTSFTSNCMRLCCWCVKRGDSFILEVHGQCGVQQNATFSCLLSLQYTFSFLSFCFGLPTSDPVATVRNGCNGLRAGIYRQRKLNLSVYFVF